MARLTPEIKIYMTQRLAMYETPSAVADAVLQEFGYEITRQRVEQYDPTKAAGANLGKKLTKIFNDTREKFLEDTSDVAVAHKAVRVRRLGGMADAAEKQRNFALAAQLLEQIAKEMGDSYTNLRRVAPTTPDGKDPYKPAHEYTSEEELDARIAELLEKTGKK